jgi:hypothetical protein
MDNVEKLPVSSLETPMLEIVSPLRFAALDAVEDLMNDAFMQVGALLVKACHESGKPLAFNRQACGLAPFLLKQLYEQASAGTLENWLVEEDGNDRYRKISDFLDLYRIQLDGFRSRYPKVFQKWTPEEDAELLRLYHQAADGEGKVRWQEFERKFGRNGNALRIRLGKLGVDLGKEKGTPRRR